MSLAAPSPGGLAENYLRSRAPSFSMLAPDAGDRDGNHLGLGLSPSRFGSFISLIPDDNYREARRGSVFAAAATDFMLELSASVAAAVTVTNPDSPPPDDPADAEQTTPVATSGSALNATTIPPTPRLSTFSGLPTLVMRGTSSTTMAQRRRQSVFTALAHAHTATQAAAGVDGALEGISLGTGTACATPAESTRPSVAAGYGGGRRTSKVGTPIGVHHPPKRASLHGATARPIIPIDGGTVEGPTEGSNELLNTLPKLPAVEHVPAAFSRRTSVAQRPSASIPPLSHSNQQQHFPAIKIPQAKCDPFPPAPAVAAAAPADQLTNRDSPAKPREQSPGRKVTLPQVQADATQSKPTHHVKFTESFPNLPSSSPADASPARSETPNSRANSTSRPGSTRTNTPPPLRRKPRHRSQPELETLRPTSGSLRATTPKPHLSHPDFLNLTDLASLAQSFSIDAVGRGGALSRIKGSWRRRWEKELRERGLAKDWKKEIDARRSRPGSTKSTAAKAADPVPSIAPTVSLVVPSINAPDGPPAESSASQLLSQPPTSAAPSTSLLSVADQGDQPSSTDPPVSPTPVRRTASWREKLQRAVKLQATASAPPKPVAEPASIVVADPTPPPPADPAPSTQAPPAAPPSRRSSEAPHRSRASSLATGAHSSSLTAGPDALTEAALRRRRSTMRTGESPSPSRVGSARAGAGSRAASIDSTAGVGGGGRLRFEIAGIEDADEAVAGEVTVVVEGQDLADSVEEMEAEAEEEEDMGSEMADLTGRRSWGGVLLGSSKRRKRSRRIWRLRRSAAENRGYLYAVCADLTFPTEKEARERDALHQLHPDAVSRYADLRHVLNWAPTGSPSRLLVNGVNPQHLFTLPPPPPPNANRSSNRGSVTKSEHAADAPHAPTSIAARIFRPNLARKCDHTHPLHPNHKCPAPASAIDGIHFVPPMPVPSYWQSYLLRRRSKGSQSVVARKPGAEAASSTSAAPFLAAGPGRRFAQLPNLTPQDRVRAEALDALVEHHAKLRSQEAREQAKLRLLQDLMLVDWIAGSESLRYAAKMMGFEVVPAQTEPRPGQLGQVVIGTGHETNEGGKEIKESAVLASGPGALRIVLASDTDVAVAPQIQEDGADVSPNKTASQYDSRSATPQNPVDEPPDGEVEEAIRISLTNILPAHHVKKGGPGGAARGRKSDMDDLDVNDWTGGGVARGSVKTPFVVAVGPAEL
ncbi:hypothetical protein HDU96_001353 [Phlyctochytrium bullatum]|nr:hypothetical protein HDU96_001353 [Phlyctochytrium bullatum]